MATLRSHCLIRTLGAPKRNALINLLRGNVIREVSNSLPEEIDLLVYAWSSITCAEWMSSLARISSSNASSGTVSRFNTVSAVPPA